MYSFLLWSWIKSNQIISNVMALNMFYIFYFFSMWLEGFTCTFVWMFVTYWGFSKGIKINLAAKEPSLIYKYITNHFSESLKPRGLKLSRWDGHHMQIQVRDILFENHEWLKCLLLECARTPQLFKSLW